jgi:hypothetical protein
MAEALHGTFKHEFVYLHGPWRTRRTFERSAIDWIDWYNTRRLHSEIGDIPPVEHENDWYRHHTGCCYPQPNQPALHETRGGSDARAPTSAGQRLPGRARANELRCTASAPEMSTPPQYCACNAG